MDLQIKLDEMKKLRLKRKNCIDSSELTTLNKEINSLKGKIYFIKNKEKIKLRRREYSIKNRDLLNKLNREYKKRHKDKIKLKKSAYLKANKEKLSIYFKKYREKNKEWYDQYKKMYRAKNKDRLAERDTNKRLLKLKVTPKWITKEELKLIDNLYKKCRDMTKNSGIKYHVDHIIPLKGKNVCGLHVLSNLQIISATENIKKSNKF